MFKFLDVKKCVLLIFFLSVCPALKANDNPFRSTPSLLKALRTLVFNPTQKNFEAFTKLCTPNNHLSYETDSTKESLTFNAFYSLISAEENVLAIRALIKSIDCSGMGASTTGIKSTIANEILVRSPKALIAALYQEKMPKELKGLVALENSEWFAVECDTPKCWKDLKAFYQEKLGALEKAVVPKEHEPLRQELISSAKRCVANSVPPSERK